MPGRDRITQRNVGEARRELQATFAARRKEEEVVWGKLERGVMGGVTLALFAVAMIGVIPRFGEIVELGGWGALLLISIPLVTTMLGTTAGRVTLEVRRRVSDKRAKTTW